MTYFIIYEDEKEYRDLYKTVILRLIGGKNENYRIIEIEKYNDEVEKKLKSIDGRKIYILDIEVPGKSGLDLARKIRKDFDDWESQLIIASTHQQFKEVSFMGRLLMLDFVSKYYNCEEHLKDALIDAINIVDKNKSLSYSLDGELYKIPYNAILYIEKGKEETFSVLTTKKSKKRIDLPFNRIWDLVKNDGRFFKSNRSCIVNLYNITKVDFNNRTIKFGQIEIATLSREKKKELRDRIGEISKE